MRASPPVVARKGLVLLEAYAKWDGKSEPDSWVWPELEAGPGERIHIGTEDEAVVVSWTEDTAVTFADFTNEMRRVEQIGAPARFVYGFTS
jgi:hypothetical protein